MSKEVMRQALEALENNRQTHYYCEDTWYSCPQHEEGCTNDSAGDECICGADEANVEIDGAITALREALAEQPPQRKPLTLREIGAACGNFSNETIKVVRQTEAAHGIKENT